jgi:hypothetical protein
MNTNLENIPVLQKTKITTPKTETPASCCTPKVENMACCEPSQTKEENNGECCAQPQDGSACCDK